jgi:hypothetical protein
MRFFVPRLWWDGMNLTTRRDLVKQFNLRPRPDYSYQNLADWEKALVDQRFENYRKACERLDR